VTVLSEFFSVTKEKMMFQTVTTKLSLDSTATKEGKIHLGRESVRVGVGDIPGRRDARREVDYILGRRDARGEVAGTGDFTCLTCRPPKSTIKKILLEKDMIDKTKTTLDNFSRVGNITLDDYLKEYDFYQTIVNLSIEFGDPTRHSLIFSRFSMLLENKAAQILKIAPDRKGISAIVKETGGSKIGISPTLEMGVSFERAGTSKTADSESSTKLILGPKIGVEGSWSKEKGYEITYNKMIENVIGAIQEENRKVLWEVYEAKLKQPEGNLKGKMISVPAFLMFWVKKQKENGVLISQKVNAKLNAIGKIKEDKPVWFDAEKPLEFVGPRQIELRAPI
jgi:hypothetical protein